MPIRQIDYHRKCYVVAVSMYRRSQDASKAVETWAQITKFLYLVLLWQTRRTDKYQEYKNKEELSFF